MIKKTCVYTLIFFLIYNAILYIWNPGFISSQGFWQDNQMKAQDYLYSPANANGDNIIVGSSMSFRIFDDSLKDVCNLALLGESYIKGIELIQHKGAYPKRIFIETNFPSTSSKGGLFYDVLYNPVLYPVRKFLPALRDGKQPLLVAASGVEHCIVTRTIPAQDRDKYSTIFHSLIEPAPGVGVFAGFDKEVPPVQLDAAFGELRLLVKDMEEHNTEVVFFEMPYYKTIQNSPRVTGIRKAFLKAFPADRYIYLPYPGYDEYQTLDGLHLGRKEAIEYTRRFSQQVDSLMHAGK